MSARPLGPPPRTKSAAVRRSMQSNKGCDTGPELKLRKLLRQSDLTGYRTGYKRASGRPDVAYPAKRLAIFLHGCFWHRCPTCKPTLPKTHRAYWRRKFQLNRARDRRQEKLLVAAGWRAVTVWECALKPKNKRRLDAALRAIRRAYDRPVRPVRARVKEPQAR